MELLYQALQSKVGIVVAITDPQADDDVDFLRQKLYNIRKADPTFGQLAIVLSPISPRTELWIIKRGQDDTPA